MNLIRGIQYTHVVCKVRVGGEEKLWAFLCYQNGNMSNSMCQCLNVYEQRSWRMLNSVPLLLRTNLCYPTIHFGSRRPGVRNNVSNKLAHALFFQNAFTSWVHRASFLKLCLKSTAIAGHVLSPAQGAALSSKRFLSFQFMKCPWLDCPVEGPTRRRGPEEQELCSKHVMESL